MVVEILGHHLVHEAEAVEGVPRVGDAPPTIGVDAVLLDIAARQRRAAQQHRHVDILARHLFQVLAHHHGGFHQQPRHADGVGPVLPRRLDDGADRLLDAEVDHLVAVIRQDDVDQVLADIVDVAPDRGENDGAFLLAFDLVHEGLEVTHRRLHGLRRLQHEGKLHLAGAEKFADHLHAVEEIGVDDLQRIVRGQRFVEVGLESLTVAVDDPLAEPLLDLFRALLDRLLLHRPVLEQGEEGMERVVAVLAPVEDQILGHPRLFLRNFVQRQDAREMDDGAGQPALERMVEEHRVQHVARRRVEAEGDVGQAEDDLAFGQFLRQPLDRIEGVKP